MYVYYMTTFFYHKTYLIEYLETFSASSKILNTKFLNGYPNSFSYTFSIAHIVYMFACTYVAINMLISFLNQFRKYVKPAGGI